MRCLTSAALLLVLLAVGTQAAPMELPDGKMLQPGGSKSFLDGFAQLGLENTGDVPPALLQPANDPWALRAPGPPPAFQLTSASMLEVPPTPGGSGPVHTFRSSQRDAASPYGMPETQRLERLSRLSSPRQKLEGLAGKVLGKKAQQRLLRGALKQKVKDVQGDGAGTAHAQLWRQPHLSQQQWDQHLSAHEAERSNKLKRRDVLPAADSRDMSRFNDDPLNDTAGSRFDYRHR